jgi:glycine/D-amino acid oxidase-like deaminating enzyme
MPRLRLNRPIWLDRDRTAGAPRFPRLSSRLDVDVAIIGGGVTGAAVAWRFAEAGARVALVDAARIGRGSTAASTALLMQEPDEDFAILAAKYGRNRARRIWQASRAATRELVGTMQRLRIRCGLTRQDSVYYAKTDEHLERLRREHRHRSAAGVGGRWLDARQARAVVGFDVPSAIRTRGNAQVDPVAACAGLMRAAARKGACIFERSPVIATRAVNTHVEVETESGLLRADRAIVATGYATPYFKPLEARFRMMNTYVIATRPLDARERRALGLRHVMLWDTGRPYYYARWTSDHRLLLGGADRPKVVEAERAAALDQGTRDIRDHFVRIYPSLADVRIDYRWEGLFAATPDGLPYVGPHRHYPRHLFALGYGGNGMTLGFLASKLLLHYYRHGSSPDQGMFAFTRGRSRRGHGG